ncbi:hypothetical protein BGZ94_010452 [Podila epigama]|nr:hypothetical protein BGZ94_010452 [Podila epigama]
MTEKAPTEKLAPFQDKKDIVKALDSNNQELLYTTLRRLRQQLNVRPNSSDPVEAAAATRALTVIYDYVEESPECPQLFKIWEWQQQNAVTKVEVPILEVLSKLIHQCNTPLYRAHSMKLTRTILQNHMTVIYRHLSSGRPNTIQATLRLLTAMNHVHHITTRELKDDFNFGLKALSKLKNQRRKETDADASSANTRTLYIQFLLAFFVRGDATVKKEVLEIPDLIQRALNDLYMDSFPLIKQTLNVLLNHIVMDNDLPRTVKISFLNTSFLVNLLRIYSLTEPVPNTDETGAMAIHKFMMALCTTPGVGICFQDASWYPPSTLNSDATVEKASTEKNKHLFNRTLSQLLLNLRPTESPLQQELTVSILSACPELVRHFWQKASIQLEPRLSARWLANMTLLHKITEIPVPNLYLQHTGLFASHPPPVSTMIENILPTPANRTILSKGLQHSSMLVRYFTIIELAAAFQKTEAVIAVMQSAIRSLANDVEDLPNANDTLDAEESLTGPTTSQSDPPALQWSNAITLLLAELRRRVPDIQIVISLHNGIQSQSLADKEEEELVRLNLFNNGVLRLIKYYQQFLPEAVSESKFDIGKLIPTDFSSVQAGTLIHLLELLLELNDFRWSNKAQDGTSSHLLKLLTLYLTTEHPQIKKLTQRLVSKLLGESILFQHDPSEAPLWIEAIPSTNYGRPDLTQDQKAFLQFLDDCIARCLRTPYKYVDQSSKILKKLQEPGSAMDIDSHQDTTELIASTLAASPNQNYAQHYSPLLMTILEQFQHVHSKENAKVIADSIASFLQRLVPTLSWNQNRSPAFALECLQRIQEQSSEEIENVLKLSMEKRVAIKGLGVTEYLALATESLKGTTGKKAAPFTKKTDGTDLLSLLDNEDRTKFMDHLHLQSSASIAHNFSKIVHFSAESLGATRCITDYIRTRMPFMGFLYDIPEVAALLNDNVDEEILDQNTIYAFLKTLPFATLFQNCTPKSVSTGGVLGLLNHAIHQAEPQYLTLYSTLVINRLTQWIQAGQAKAATTNACFKILTTMLESTRSNEIVFADFKTRLWEQFTLRDLYLFDAGGVKNDVLEAFSEHTVDLLVVSMKPMTSSSGGGRIAGSHLMLSSYFLRKTVERVALELENVKKTGGSALQAKTVRYLSKLAFMCSVSDLSMLLQSLLGLHRHPKFTATAAFNALLSTILKHIARQSGSASAIPIESAASLLDLWQKQPSEELDEIVLDTVCGRLWPNAMAETMGPLDLTTPGVFDLARDKLHRPMIESLDLSLVDFILEKHNRQRAMILAALLTASSQFRQRFADRVINMYDSKRDALLENEDFAPLVHAYLTRLSIKNGDQYTWSACSPQDKDTLKALRPLLLPTLVRQIASSSYSSKETLVAAGSAAIIISLSVDKEDEDDVASVWSMLDNIPRVGLDSIHILEALLVVTKEVHEDLQIERQDRISRWFETTAQRLIVVLDEHGDAEWLEPVCDRLYNILESHVIERKLSIDQKILFELVSFAIEKALDNVELVRFSAFLAKHYYVETSQSSVLPQILQTLFKHKQFSSLIMSTAPTTKHFIPENHKSRLAIVQLIYTLTTLEPTTCCKAGFLPTLLSCYSASTSVADELLLAVLRITESQTGGSISNRAPVWGTGSDHVKSSGSLFGQAMINESLELIDASVMMTSLTHFPLDRALESAAPTVTLQDYSEDVLKRRQAPIYDPCFMLPLFATYMAFGTQLDCRKLIECNGLGLIIAALSSHDDTMRLAAFSLLDDFYGIISLATMREKNQVMLLLDTLKNSIVDREDDKPAPRIPTAIVVFVAHALSTLLRPDHFMYPHVNKFCLQRPTIDMEDIPMFYSLFNSSSEHHRKERVWMLRLLSASLKSADDYKLFKRRHVIDLLVAFFNSQLSEPLSKKIVIEILFNASSIPKVSLQMITQSAFLSWLHTLSSMSAMSFENEFSLVPSRLLLRYVQSCPKENIKWMNGIWINQVSGIATTLLFALSAVKVTTSNLPWALTVLESILQVFSYLESASQSHPGAPLGPSLFTHIHTHRLLQVLSACEQVMVVTPEQTPTDIPESKAWDKNAKELSPKQSDPLDLLYTIDPMPMRSHSRVIRLGFDLICTENGNHKACHKAGSQEAKQALLARALCYIIPEAIEQARQITAEN